MFSSSNLCPHVSVNETKPSKRSRSYDNCASCRTSRQSCDPRGRDWNRGQRCDRCIKKGLPCGPSERKPPKHTRMPHIIMSPSLVASNETEPVKNLTPPKGRPLVPMFQNRASVGSPANSSLPHQVSNLESCSSGSQRDAAQQPEELLKNIELRGKAYGMLYRRLRELSYTTSKLGIHNSLSDLNDSIMTKLHILESDIARFSDQIPWSFLTRLEQKLLCKQLITVLSPLRQASMLGRAAYDREQNFYGNQILQNILDNIRSHEDPTEPQPCEVPEQLLAGSSDPNSPVSRSNLAKYLDFFRQHASDLNDLSFLPGHRGNAQNLSQHGSGLNSGISPECLALSTGHRSIALELFVQAGPRAPNTDILGRNLVAFAVENDDIELLLLIRKRGLTLLRLGVVHLDHSNLTPLDLSVLKDNLKIFRMLYEQTVTPENRQQLNLSLEQLAARANSTSILDYLRSLHSSARDTGDKATSFPEDVSQQLNSQATSLLDASMDFFNSLETISGDDIPMENFSDRSLKQDGEGNMQYFHDSAFALNSFNISSNSEQSWIDEYFNHSPGPNTSMGSVLQSSPEGTGGNHSYG